MRILGIDPGLNTTGYAVLEVTSLGPRVIEAGILRSFEGRKKTEMAERLVALYSGIVEVIEDHHPEVASIEQLYAHYSHPQTAILMGHARGALMLACAQRSLRIISYNATRIKKTITGAGRASKEQVQQTMLRELKLAVMPEPHDVADALAAALCHYYAEFASGRPAVPMDAEDDPA